MLRLASAADPWLQLAPGVYEFHREVPIRGVVAGIGQGVILRRTGRARRIFRAVDSLRVYNLTFDLDSTRNYTVGVGADDVPVAEAHGCHFDAGAPKAGWTIMGVAFRGVGRAAVLGCTSRKAQIKLGGSGTTTGYAVVKGNHVQDGHNFGISYVSNGDRLEGCLIQDNIIVGGRGGGIYVGSDGDSQTGAIHDNMQVRDNHVTLSTHKACILARAGLQTRHMRIVGNTLVGGFAGILAKGTDGDMQPYRDLLIDRNVFEGSQYAVRLNQAVKGLRYLRNRGGRVYIKPRFGPVEGRWVDNEQTRVPGSDCIVSVDTPC